MFKSAGQQPLERGRQLPCCCCCCRQLAWCSYQFHSPCAILPPSHTHSLTWALTTGLAHLADACMGGMCAVARTLYPTLPLRGVSHEDVAVSLVKSMQAGTVDDDTWRRPGAPGGAGSCSHFHSAGPHAALSTCCLPSILLMKVADDTLLKCHPPGLLIPGFILQALTLYLPLRACLPCCVTSRLLQAPPSHTHIHRPPDPGVHPAGPHARVLQRRRRHHQHRGVVRPG